jgi:hypothetical protein
LQAKALYHARPFIFSPAQSRKASARLAKLSESILRRNFEQAWDADPAALASGATKGRVLVLSSDRKFYRSFRSKYHGRTEFFRLSPKTLSAAAVRMASPRFQWLVYYASGTQTARWLAGLDIELRKRTIVINANHAGEVTPSTSFLSLLNINSGNPQSGEWLAEGLLRTPRRQSAS